MEKMESWLLSDKDKVSWFDWQLLTWGHACLGRCLVSSRPSRLGPGLLKTGMTSRSWTKLIGAWKQLALGRRGRFSRDSGLTHFDCKSIRSYRSASDSYSSMHASLSNRHDRGIQQETRRRSRRRGGSKPCFVFHLIKSKLFQVWGQSWAAFLLIIIALCDEQQQWQWQQYL